MSGYAEADFVYVAAGYGGTLQALAVRRGDAARQGQPLFSLDTEAETLDRAAAQARSEAALAQAEDLRKGKRPLELAAIDQQLAQARAALAASASALDRNRALVAQGYIAAVQLDALAAARDRDAARLRELEADRAQATQASRADAIAAAAAQARGAGAEAEQARWRVGQKQRTAPVDAQVYDVMYRVGEWVPAGSPVVALLPAGAVKLRFFVPQPLLAQVVVGSQVAVSCDGCAAGLAARVRWVSPQAEFTPPVIYAAGSRGKLVFMVEADPPPGAPLKPGQPVDVRLKSPA